MVATLWTLSVIAAFVLGVVFHVAVTTNTTKAFNTLHARFDELETIIKTKL